MALQNIYPLSPVEDTSDQKTGFILEKENGPDKRLLWDDTEEDWFVDDGQGQKRVKGERGVQVKSSDFTVTQSDTERTFIVDQDIRADLNVTLPTSFPEGKSFFIVNAGESYVTFSGNNLSNKIQNAAVTSGNTVEVVYVDGNWKTSSTKNVSIPSQFSFTESDVNRFDLISDYHPSIEDAFNVHTHTISDSTGASSLKWTVEKDSSVSLGDDAAYINEIELPDGTVYDFSSGNIPAEFNNNPSGSDAGWSLIQYRGEYVLKSDEITYNETAEIELNKSISQGDVKFDYGVSSEDTYDFFRFYVDGVQEFSESGQYDLMIDLETSPDQYNNRKAVNGVYIDSENSIWYAVTESNGYTKVTYVEYDLDEERPVRRIEEDDNGNVINTAWGIYLIEEIMLEEKNGYLWGVTTSYGGSSGNVGVFRIDPSDGSTEVFLAPSSITNVTGSDYSVTIDNALEELDKVIFNNLGNNIVSFDINSENWEFVVPQSNDHPGYHINGIYVPSTDEIWLNSYEFFWIYKKNQSTGKFELSKKSLDFSDDVSNSLNVSGPLIYDGDNDRLVWFVGNDIVGYIDPNNRTYSDEVKVGDKLKNPGERGHNIYEANRSIYDERIVSLKYYKGDLDGSSSFSNFSIVLYDYKNKNVLHDSGDNDAYIVDQFASFNPGNFGNYGNSFKLVTRYDESTLENYVSDTSVRRNEIYLNETLDEKIATETVRIKKLFDSTTNFTDLVSKSNITFSDQQESALIAPGNEEIRNTSSEGWKLTFSEESRRISPASEKRVVSSGNINIQKSDDKKIILYQGTDVARLFLPSNISSFSNDWSVVVVKDNDGGMVYIPEEVTNSQSVGIFDDGQFVEINYDSDTDEVSVNGDADFGVGTPLNFFEFSTVDIPTSIDNPDELTGGDVLKTGQNSNVYLTALSTSTDREPPIEFFKFTAGIDTDSEVLDSVEIVDVGGLDQRLIGIGYDPSVNEAYVVYYFGDGFIGEYNVVYIDVSDLSIIKEITISSSFGNNFDKVRTFESEPVEVVSRSGSSRGRLYGTVHEEVLFGIDLESESEIKEIDGFVFDMDTNEGFGVDDGDTVIAAFSGGLFTYDLDLNNETEIDNGQPQRPKGVRYIDKFYAATSTSGTFTIENLGSENTAVEFGSNSTLPTEPLQFAGGFSGLNGFLVISNETTDSVVLDLNEERDYDNFEKIIGPSNVLAPVDSFKPFSSKYYLVDENDGVFDPFRNAKGKIRSFQTEVERTQDNGSVRLELSDFKKRSYSVEVNNLGNSILYFNSDSPDIRKAFSPKSSFTVTSLEEDQIRTTTFDGKSVDIPVSDTKNYPSSGDPSLLGIDIGNDRIYTGEVTDSSIKVFSLQDESTTDQLNLPGNYENRSWKYSYYLDELLVVGDNESNNTIGLFKWNKEDGFRQITSVADNGTNTWKVFAYPDGTATTISQPDISSGVTKFVNYDLESDQVLNNQELDTNELGANFFPQNIVFSYSRTDKEIYCTSRDISDTFVFLFRNFNDYTDFEKSSKNNRLSNRTRIYGKESDRYYIGGEFTNSWILDSNLNEFDLLNNVENFWLFNELSGGIKRYYRILTADSNVLDPYRVLSASGFAITEGNFVIGQKNRFFKTDKELKKTSSKFKDKNTEKKMRSSVHELSINDRHFLNISGDSDKTVLIPLDLQNVEVGSEFKFLNSDGNILEFRSEGGSINSVTINAQGRFLLDENAEATLRKTGKNEWKIISDDLYKETQNGFEEVS